jgi:hypothetical protein
MRVLLLVLTVFASVVAKAQAVFEIETPANLKKFYTIGVGDSLRSRAYFGVALWGNGDISKKSVRGELKLVNSKDSVAGTALSEDFTGKIAVIYRGGGIGYAQKALNAQNAGAIGVIILNHGIQQDNTVKADEVFDFSGALAGENGTNATGLKVTIPAVMVSKNDRDAIVAELKLGSTVIGNIGKKRVLDYDLAIEPVVVGPMYRTRPLSLTKAGMVHDTLGMVVYNKGAQNIYNILGVVDVRQRGGNSLFADTIFVDSMEAAGVDKRDTLYFTFQNPFTNKADLTTGTYDIKYSLITLKQKTALDTVLLDQYNADNTVSTPFAITDSINAVGYLTSYTAIKSNVGDTIDYVDQPYWSTALYAGPITEAFKACTVFENDHAKGLQISGVDFLGYSFDPNTSSNYLLGKKFGIEVYQWSPSIENIFDANFGIKTDDLISLYTGEYTFDKKYKSHYGNFNLPDNAVELQDDARYLVCATTNDTILGFGFDRSFNNKWTIYYNNRMLSPVYVDGKYYSSGFGLDATTTISLRISEATDKSGVNELAANSIRVTPNPSTGKFNIVAAQGTMEVVVTDMAGKVVYNYSNKNHTSITHTFDISNVETGVYVAKIVNNGETSIVKLQVAK